MEEGPFVIALTQNLDGMATVVWAAVSYNKKDAMAKAKHFVLEKKPPEYRCDPETDSVSVTDLSVSPTHDILEESTCQEWRREAGIHQRVRRSKGKKEEPLRIVDFRNAE